MNSEDQSMNFKEIQLDIKSATNVLIHFVKKAQMSGKFKLGEAGLLDRARNVFNGTETEISQSQAYQLLVNALHVGQAGGSYSLEEAGFLHNKVLPFLASELNKKTQNVTEPNVKTV